jgi:hypothetical protein
MGMGQLCEPLRPMSFVAWARQNDIEFPDELEDAIIGRAEGAANRKTRYEERASGIDDTQLDGANTELLALIRD